MSSTVALPRTDPPRSLPWLFGPVTDLLTFTGSAVLAFVLVGVGFQFGLVHSDTPEWTWLTSILLIDVAHVYATGFRVYFVSAEMRRRPVLYVAAPVLCFVVGQAVYSLAGPDWFWRLLAYLAVFHFVRQQYGWIALYRARAGERDRFGRFVDSAAIYLATVYPLVYWHAHPRVFAWFVENDFFAVSKIATTGEQILRPLYWSALAAYFARSIYRGLSNGRWNPGKDLVVLTTALCWYIGIVAINSDYVFTVTNVIIHGIPYMVLVYWQRAKSSAPIPTGGARRIGRIVSFLGLLWILAYAEELIWHRAVWNEHQWLFGAGWLSDARPGWLVPLLAVPQATHYVLDGFIWKRRSNKLTVVSGPPAST